MSARRREFGATWWGRAWLDALEGRAVHDPNRLPRGRTYARRGDARNLQIQPGRATATVRGSRVEPYEVLLELRRFRDDEWEWVLDAIAGTASHAAALLDGELDPGIVDQARSAEVELLPRSGELRTACTCPDDAEPCKHAAAVCYLMADAIDEDPFVLFVLRGMDRTGVLDAVRSRRAAAETPGPTSPPPLAEPGVIARDAWNRALTPLPHPPAPRSRPGRPAAWPSDPPRGAPFDGDGLRRLANDAVRRAWRMRAEDEPSALELGREDDLARRAAGADRTERLLMADQAGIGDAQLAAIADAWAVAGADGVRVVGEPSWTPPVTEMIAARDRVAATAGPRSTLQVRGDRITVDGTEQFRRSRDGHWYHFAKVSGRWTLQAGPAAEVDDLLAGDAES